MKLENLDPAFRQDGGDEKLIYVDIKHLPVRITGFPWLEENGNYHRLPDKFEHLYSDKLNALRKCTSGGAIRFKTNTHVLGLKWEMEEDTLDGSTRITENATKGFDLYLGEPGNTFFRGAFNAIAKDGAQYHCAIHLSDFQEMREITINFPLYGGVKYVLVGIDPDAVIEMPSPMKYERPVVFYGSSITQGGCASRPGMNYTALLTRKLGVDQINLGFSGSARGEDFIAEMISDIPMSVFVFDYDHNSRKVEHLKATHEEFFKIIRRKNPDLPIIMLSRPNTDKYEGREIAFKNVILETYNNALASGDKNVYFIDGETLFGKEDRLECTVDQNHPNDLGFYRMYERVLPVLQKALESVK